MKSDDRASLRLCFLSSTSAISDDLSAHSKFLKPAPTKGNEWQIPNHRLEEQDFELRASRPHVTADMRNRLIRVFRVDRMKINSPLTDLSRVLSSLQSSLRPHASSQAAGHERNRVAEAAAEVANSPRSRRRRSCVSCIDVVFNSNRFDRGAVFRMYGVAFG